MFRLLLALFAAGLLIGQPPDTGVEFNLKVEVSWVGAGENPRTIPSSMQRALPDGAASWQISTDARSLRSALTGRYLDLPSGSIVLQQDGNDERYVPNPSERSFYGRRSEGMPPDEALEDVRVRESAEVDRIANFETRKVVIEFRRPLPPAVVAAGRTTHMQTEIVNWCSSGIGLASNIEAAVDQRVQNFTPRQIADQVKRVCRVALKSSYRLVSSTPDYAIVSTVTSVAAARLSPAAFQVPEGYHRVQMP